jgi:hypothetical protein
LQGAVVDQRSDARNSLRRSAIGAIVTTGAGMAAGPSVIANTTATVPVVQQPTCLNEWDA